jgi:hypothetical protein
MLHKLTNTVCLHCVCCCRESDAVHAYRAAQHRSISSSNGEQRNGRHTAAIAANGVTEKTVPMFEGIHLVFRCSKHSSVEL